MSSTITMPSTKRICILCGICKTTRHYNVTRGIKKIANIIPCENCRRFYLKLKEKPYPLDCISPIKGSCYSKCSFMQTRCKGCWAMQILDSCPHPKSFYMSLSSYLSEECKKQIRGLPVDLEDIDVELRGKATIEINENDEWIESPTSKEEIEELLKETDEVPQDDEEEKSKTDSQQNNSISSGGGSKTTMQKNDNNKTDIDPLQISDLAIEIDDDIDAEEEEALVDDPISMDVDSIGEYPVGRRRSSKGGERTKRKRKQVEYFTKQASSNRKGRGQIYGPDGKIIKTGMDLCDCLQPECVGCHFPCPKCRSPKCGNECRVNRRWYYERVEVEGTKMFWVNKFIPKN